MYVAGVIKHFYNFHTTTDKKDNRGFFVLLEKENGIKNKLFNTIYLAKNMDDIYNHVYVYTRSFFTVF